MFKGLELGVVCITSPLQRRLLYLFQRSLSPNELKYFKDMITIIFFYIHIIMPRSIMVPEEQS